MNTEDIAKTPASGPSGKHVLKSKEFWIILAVTAIVAGVTVAIIFMNWSSWTSFCLCQLPTDLAPSSDELLRGWTR